MIIATVTWRTADGRISTTQIERESKSAVLQSLAMDWDTEVILRVTFDARKSTSR